MRNPRKAKSPGRDYFELLRDPRWQRRRLEIMERDSWTCKYCGDSTKNLQVHHSSYIYGRMPWEYSDESLHTLCDKCHEEETALSRTFKRVMLFLPPGNMERLIGYVMGMVVSRWELPEAEPVPVDSHNQAQGLADFFGVTDEEVIDSAIANGGSADSATLINLGIDRMISARRRRRSPGKAK